jgi:hydroxymethylglutaryl-CoA lyase
MARLLALREAAVRWLPDQPLHGALWRAGLPRTYPAPSGAA